MERERKKTTESRVRQKARRAGYYVEKSRQSEHVNNRGKFMLVDGFRNEVIVGADFDATLAQIEEYLDEQNGDRAH